MATITSLALILVLSPFLFGLVMTTSSTQLTSLRRTLSTTVRPRPTTDRNRDAEDKYRPRNVIAQVINSTTVKVQWDHAKSVIESPIASTAIGCPIARYTIRLKTDEAGSGSSSSRRRSVSVAGTASRSQRRTSRTWKLDGGRRSITLHDLTPSTTYYVRVLAVGCDGTRSKPSQWIGLHTGMSPPAEHALRSQSPGPSQTSAETGNNNVTNAIRSNMSRREERGGELPEMDDERQTVNDGQESSTPGKPTYVRTRTFSDSVMVSWLPPDDGSVVRGYMIGYGEGVPDVNWQYVDATRNNVTIKNLKAATQYIVSLRAFNNHGKGQVVYDLIYTRDIAGPAVASPTNLRTKILSPTTAWLQWTDSTLGRTQQVTDNRYYNVHYRPLPSVGGAIGELGGASGGKTLSMIVKDLHVVFYDLHPGTRYEFKVRTVKDAVASAFSDSVVNKTFETAPSSPPRNVVVVATNVSGTVRVTWKPPRIPNGDITGYLVLYTQNTGLPADQWQAKTVAGPETETLVENLTTDATFHFRVQSRNTIGYSPTSSNSVFYTKPYPAVPPQRNSLTTVATATMSTRAASIKSRSSDLTPADEVMESPKLDDEIDDDEGDEDPEREQGEGIDVVPSDGLDTEDIWQKTAHGDHENDHEESSLLPSLEGITPAAIIQVRQGQSSVILPSPSFDSSTSPAVMTGSSKTMRDPEGAVASFDNVTTVDSPVASHDGDRSEHQAEQKSNRSISTSSLSSSSFKVIVRHRVTAYITWPQQQHHHQQQQRRCADARPVSISRRPPVIGYQLRYYGDKTTTSGDRENASTEAVVLNLASNVALLDDLRPNTEYRYQLKTVYADGSDSGWSEQNLINTR